MGQILTFRRQRRVSAANIRMMIWSGLILGLLAYQMFRPPAPSSVRETRATAAIATPAADPYAESQRSRAILEKQEGSAGGAPSKQRGLQPTAPVRVIDGDTFDYGGVRIRIADIDTPEVNGRCAYERDLAERATRRMEALLAAGPFELAPGGDGRDEDRYGRKLRIVMRSGGSLGGVLVTEGLAREWTGRRQPWC